MRKTLFRPGLRDYCNILYILVHTWYSNLSDPSLLPSLPLPESLSGQEVVGRHSCGW